MGTAGGIQQQEQALLGEGTCRKRITGKGIFLSSLLACLSMYSRRANRRAFFGALGSTICCGKKSNRKGEGRGGAYTPLQQFFPFSPVRTRERNSFLPPPLRFQHYVAAKGGGRRNTLTLYPDGGDDDRRTKKRGRGEREHMTPPASWALLPSSFRGMPGKRGD